MKKIKHIKLPKYDFDHCEVFGADEQKIDRCAQLYATDSEHRFALGAGIYTSTWVSGGANERRSHAKLYPYRHALHAEQVALMSARCDISGATMYICRLSPDGNSYRMSLPCFWCTHTLIKAGISKVVYTTDDSEVKAFKMSTVQIPSLTEANIDYRLIA